jgi:serine-type D-Ala-D-Ala carboxypeptidase/endopeptidase
MSTRFLLAAAALMAAPVASGAAPAASPFDATDRIFEEFRLESHIPGLVYGVVVDGKLVHVGAMGTAELDSKRAVTADTLFRIASMTKAFTALTVLKLRDEGKVRLDAPAENYVPEMRGWKYPSTDSPKIRVRDLLNHVAGFVTDDPWGDRQTPLPEKDFTRLLREGVPFTRVPAMGYEYSNLGYALLGRIVTNVSHRPYAETISGTLLTPLAMRDSGFVADAAPLKQRAMGYRWEDEAWRLEPTLGPGSFGAMGGLQTSANDYAHWVAYLLSAWPPRDGVDAGPVNRATVREMSQGSNFPRFRKRPGRAGAASCTQAVTYAMGFNTAIDCDLGLTLSHSGGYPGFGSHVLLLPDRGVGLFAFANRTYAGASRPVWDAAMTLLKAGALGTVRDLPVSDSLRDAYRASGAMYAAGSIAPAREMLAMNFLLDRAEDGRARDIRKLKEQVGSCDVNSAIAPTGALTGDFNWRCERGTLKGTLQLAPTAPPQIQSLDLAVSAAADPAPIPGTALITGSDGGIGFALVQEFESRGWQVIATTLDPVKATALADFAKAHPLVTIEKLDVTDTAGIDALAVKLKDQPIDALVNNAGITGSFEGQTLARLDRGDFERVLRVNSYGPLRVSAAFLDLVARSRQRKIIAVSSGYGSLASVENIAASGYPSYYFYAMSKAALNMGMREFALEAGAPRGVTTVMVSPGAVDTPMQRDIRANMERLGKPITAPTSTPAQVAHAMVLAIEQLTPDRNGMFISLSGKEVPW